MEYRNQNDQLLAAFICSRMHLECGEMQKRNSSRAITVPHPWTTSEVEAIEAKVLAEAPRGDKLALDLTMQATGGLMSTTGEKGGRPLKAGVPVADFMSGAHLYDAIMTALFERCVSGRGRAVDVSMLESLFVTLLPAARHAFESNEAPKRTGNRHVAVA